MSKQKKPNIPIIAKINVSIKIANTLEEFLKVNYSHVGLVITEGDPLTAKNHPKENFSIFLTNRLTEPVLISYIVLYYKLNEYQIDREDYAIHVHKGEERLLIITTHQILFPPPILKVTVIKIC
jgi:hypothetical protein